MNKPTILYLIRNEPDFERIICLARSGKNNYDQHFIFAGDYSTYFNEGIKNKFNILLSKEIGIKINDYYIYDKVARALKYFIPNYHLCVHDIKTLPDILKYLLFNVFKYYTNKRKHQIVNTIFNKINPAVLVTDQSAYNKEYLPEIFRQSAFQRKITSIVISHGAAGGLHRNFTPQLPIGDYNESQVFVCNKKEHKANLSNRIVIGDFCSSFPYVQYLNRIEHSLINFMPSAKYKIGIFYSGTIMTSTNGWDVMRDIIIDYSERDDVAFVLKLHPRETPPDLRMLNTFSNLLIVNREVDRSRVTKWADIIIASDHCSTIFEPMILEKKVIAIKGNHIPRYKGIESPILNSSVNCISSSDQLIIEKLKPANAKDPIINEMVWGGNGPIDLADRFFKYLDTVGR